MTETPSEPKIRIEQLTKIFGAQSEEALKLLHDGATKDEILEQTGCGVEVADANFTVASGEIVVGDTGRVRIAFLAPCTWDF